MSRIITDHLSQEISDAFYDAFKIRFNFVFGADNYTLPSDDNRVIVYSLIFEEESNSQFVALVNSIAKQKMVIDSIDVLLITILHEIGHIFTWYTFSNKEIKQYQRDKIRLDKMAEADPTKEKEALDAYMKLPVEIAATKFAVYWLKSHDAAYVMLHEKLANAVNRFYIENNIDETDVEKEIKED